MLVPISKMAAQVQPSATLAAGAKARQLKADGIQVFDFSLGEPDFNTPEHICKAAYQAMKDGHTHYTPAAGIPELRGAIAKNYRKVGLEVTTEQVIVSNGAKHSLHNTLAALVVPGDDVIILPAVSNEEAQQKYPGGWKAPKPYLRIVPQPK